MKFDDSKYSIAYDPDGATYLDFPFEIGKSFRSKNYRHPITIPLLFNDLLHEHRVTECENVKLIVDSYLASKASIRGSTNNSTYYFQITSHLDQGIVDSLPLKKVINIGIAIQTEEILIFINRDE